MTIFGSGGALFSPTQGLCCPVYTERKTGQPTLVISVAVKAVAVARGYIANEGNSHRVVFQPFLRMQHMGGVPTADLRWGCWKGVEKACIWLSSLRFASL